MSSRPQSAPHCDVDADRAPHRIGNLFQDGKVVRKPAGVSGRAILRAVILSEASEAESKDPLKPENFEYDTFSDFGGSLDS